MQSLPPSGFKPVRGEFIHSQLPLVAFKELALDTSSIRELLRECPADWVVEGNELNAHSSDMVSASPPPHAVIRARTVEHVQWAVNMCSAHGLPLIPYGVGTSLGGHYAAAKGGVSLDMSAMDSISVFADDFLVTVGAGCRLGSLTKALGAQSLVFPIDVGADATIGGMLATNASGASNHSMRDVAVAITVVLADGTVTSTRSMAPKSSAGYDLTGILVGSEGTLAVIVEATLRILPRPESRVTAALSFDSLHAAVNGVFKALQLGIPFDGCYLMDPVLLRAARHHRPGKFPVDFPCVLLEFCGPRDVVQAGLDLLQHIPTSNMQLDTTGELWGACSSIAWNALPSAFPGKRLFPVDVSLPLASLARCLRECHEEASRSNLTISFMGNIARGTFIALLVADSYDAVSPFIASTIKRAQSMHGTCTAEHGVGSVRRSHLSGELSATALDLMRRIKHAFDPRGLLNPSKVLP